MAVLRLSDSQGDAVWFSGSFVVGEKGKGEQRRYVVIQDKTKYEFPLTVDNRMALEIWAAS